MLNWANFVLSLRYRPAAASVRIGHSVLALMLAVLCGCRLGPDYQRPVLVAPPEWQWKVAEPKDQIPRGAWWTIFQDPQLDALEHEATEANQDLKAAMARVDAARATARFRRSDFFPSLDGNVNWQRYRTSGTRPSPLGTVIPSFTQAQWDVPFDLSYEVDLWGKMRRSMESARDSALALEAARQSLLLRMQADVAAHYFSLQSAGREVRLLEDAIQLRQEALTAFQQRLQAGLGSEFEVQRAKVEVASAAAELAAARQHQAELIHALAVLCGQPASGFKVAIGTNLPIVPLVAPGLPSALLERRPDVAEAEALMAARNAEIGVAKTAFFPSLRLTAAGGFQSGIFQDLAEWDSRNWSVGPGLSIPIFQAGRGGANLKRVKAVYEESVAVYRQRVLVAFQEVEDSLAAIHFLGEQAKSRNEAAEAAVASTGLAFARYRAGAVNFLEVVDSEAARLRNETARIRAAEGQQLAVVRLIKALGGGWEGTPGVPETLAK